MRVTLHLPQFIGFGFTALTEIFLETTHGKKLQQFKTRELSNLIITYHFTTLVL